MLEGLQNIVCCKKECATQKSVVRFASLAKEKASRRRFSTVSFLRRTTSRSRRSREPHFAGASRRN